LIAHTPCNKAKRGAKAIVNTRATTLMIADSSLLSLNVLIADQEMLKSAIPQINIIVVSFIVVLRSSFSGELCLEKVSTNLGQHSLKCFQSLREDSIPITTQSITVNINNSGDNASRRVDTQTGIPSSKIFFFINSAEIVHTNINVKIVFIVFIVLTL